MDPTGEFASSVHNERLHQAQITHDQMKGWVRRINDRIATRLQERRPIHRQLRNRRIARSHVKAAAANVERIKSRIAERQRLASIETLETTGTAAGVVAMVIPGAGDLVGAGVSGALMWKDPSWARAGDLGGDLLGVLPFVPALGTMRRAERLLDSADDVRDAYKGIRIRNKGLAGQAHPKTNIPFDKNGFPDFSSVSKSDVSIKYTGTRLGDTKAANSAAGYSTTPEGYTWHHHQDGTTMQLVPTDIHQQTGHTGGFSLF